MKLKTLVQIISKYTTQKKYAQNPLIKKGFSISISVYKTNDKYRTEKRRYKIDILNSLKKRKKIYLLVLKKPTNRYTIRKFTFNS